MAVNTILRAMVAVALQVRDNIYATFLALPLMMIGAIFLWSYISTSRKDYGY